MTLTPEQIADATTYGTDAGRAAGTWIEIASERDARSILEDVDPEVLDRYEAPAPLATIPTDDPLLADIYRYVVGSDAPFDHDDLAEVGDLYENAYHAAYEQALRAAAVAYLEPLTKTCGACGHQWTEPTPADRCPEEADHPEEPAPAAPTFATASELWGALLGAVSDDDDDADTLERLAIAAGYLWQCACRWANDAGDRACGQCGADRPGNGR